MKKLRGGKKKAARPPAWTTGARLLAAGGLLIFILGGCSTTKYRTRYIEPHRFPPEWRLYYALLSPAPGGGWKVEHVSDRRMDWSRGMERLVIQLYSEDQIIVQPDFDEFSREEYDCMKSLGYSPCSSRMAKYVGQSVRGWDGTLRRYPDMVVMPGTGGTGPRYVVADPDRARDLAEQANLWDALRSYLGGEIPAVIR